MSKFSQQGVSLYLSIMIMAILLSIVLGISGILLGQLKTMKGIENSVIAFYAADTGIEKVLKKVLKDREDPDIQTGYYDGSVGDAIYEIKVLLPGEPNCNALYYCINSLGTYDGIQRAIQVYY